MAKRVAGRRRAARGVSADAQQSLIAIAVFAVGIIALLALLGFAGSAGVMIDRTLAQGLGWGRIMLPIAFLVLGADVALGERRLCSVSGAIALVLGLLGITGLLNILGDSGGALGQVISLWVGGALGDLVATVIALCAIVASAVVFANVSLRELAAIVPLLRRAQEDTPLPVPLPAEPDDVEEEEEDLEDVEEEAEEENDAGRAPMPRAGVITARAPEETVMTVSERRTITIPMDMLDGKRSDPKAGDINRNQEIIVRTLEQFGIPVEMGDVRVGPTVTQYAFRPAQGVKLSRVVALQNDLALALAAHPIRIEAPIPGKALVGIEVPNHVVARVSLREILESPDFDRRKSPFTVPLGKDISGSVPLLAVERAPHMLVAGATGSGKSVCLNTLIIALLYQNGPDDLKFILIDPKRVELGIYTGIPHLLVPPIVKAEEAVNALKWAVREMERRLDYLAKFGARDIDAYNTRSEERMPRIIIVIDELADLMLQNRREVEATIVRIAQMARATGIHLVLATQRPSVDVITGTIKANIPTRLAFAVASQVDSKTILDISGAEKLLGRGDMLMMTPELSKPRRVQGAFVGDTEISRVVNFLKEQSTPEYNYQVTDPTSGAGGVVLDPESTDALFADAVQIAIDAGRVSTSYLQRRMKIGYSRAARIVDLMEQYGVVAAADGAKPREVLVDSWPPEGVAAPVPEDSPADDDEEIFEDDADGETEDEDLVEEESEEEMGDEKQR